ncbi:MAG: FliM/FliN family flagellar motor switch protein, partial [Proteobacteria bacterium]|nr:FliM/FliN family flagellar motor switch protein [Pseudomonadota bacterium]
LTLGARPGTGRVSIPVRAYTRIERRFYRRFANEMIRGLERAWAHAVDLKVEQIRVLQNGPGLAEPDESVLVATLDVKGMAELCRLRVALPASKFAKREEAGPDIGLGNAGLREELMSMTVAIRAELGSVELPIGEVADLQIGRVLALDEHEDGRLLVRVEGTPMFLAERGSVGRRLAVRLDERVE